MATTAGYHDHVTPPPGAAGNAVTRTFAWRRWDSNPRPPACKQQGGESLSVHRRLHQKFSTLTHSHSLPRWLLRWLLRRPQSASPVDMVPVGPHGVAAGQGKGSLPRPSTGSNPLDQVLPPSKCGLERVVLLLRPPPDPVLAVGDVVVGDINS